MSALFFILIIGTSYGMFVILLRVHVVDCLKIKYTIDIWQKLFKRGVAKGAGGNE